MNHTRERFNAKARSSTAGSSHKKRKRTKKIAEGGNGQATEGYQLADPNAEIIVQKSAEAKEQDRKERLRRELLNEANSKLNGKKKKRLEKYIEKKLKAEERVVLLEKLSKSQAELPNALGLQSSATLGTGAAKTHQERLDRDEDKEVRRAFDGSTLGKAKGAKRRKRQYTQNAPSGLTDDSNDGTDSDAEMMSSSEEEGRSRSNPVVIVDSGFSTAPADANSSITRISDIGSALQRNADGSVVAPRVSKRKAKQPAGAFSSWDRKKSKLLQEQADSDTSFDSSDSAYDSDNEEHQDAQEHKSDPDSDAEDDEALEEEGLEEKGPRDTIQEDLAVLSPPPQKRKRIGFKEWAMQQLSAAKGYVAPVTDFDAASSLEQEIFASLPKKRKKEIVAPGEVRGPLGEDLVFPDTALANHMQGYPHRGHNNGSTRKVVLVSRPPDVEEARLLLPIVSEEQVIVESILLNNVVIICGETGSGKTTQVPQFLYEAGFGVPSSDNPGMIGITQPRRVAAMSMASRVAYELSLSSSKVSYQIRYDATVSPDTSVKFMTDGVLLRELATDFLLTKYSVIIIDEAHERSMNTDILIGVLSRVIKLREKMWLEKRDDVMPLRLIVMSATLRVSDFAENTTLFSTPPPIINVAARQHPVTIHFSRRTQPDYVTEAIRKASKIHSRLPPGGILIFLTGQNEIIGVCRKLEARYGSKALEDRKKRRSQSVSYPFTESDVEQGPLSQNVDVEAEDLDLCVSEAQDIALDVDGDPADIADDEALDSDDDNDNAALGIESEESDVPMHIVPLYALLESEKQMRVFQPPPPGKRLVVVATNVAETSLTIPGIRYVVDCGRAKERRYDVANGIQSFQIGWVSKASAAQRAGRAGRTGPGHCYRLYSSALYENYFDQFSQPEILRMPIEGVVLQMKSMHIDSVMHFPFPTSPDRTNLRKAETVLTHLGALNPSASDDVGSGNITPVGKAMSLFPLSPRYARMLVSGRQHGCMPYIITVVAALSVGDPFVRAEGVNDVGSEDEGDENSGHPTSEDARAKEARRFRRRAFFQSQQLHASLGSQSSDVFRILSVVGAYEYAGGGHKFCQEQFVRPKAMEEIHKLRAQIHNIVQSNFPDVEIGFVAKLKPPNGLQLKVIRQLLTAGFIDQVAVRKDRFLKNHSSGHQYTTSRGVPYQAMGVKEDVFVHPSSVLFNMPPPDFVIFTEIVRTTHVWMKGVTIINVTWLSSLGRSLCTYSKPVKNREGESMVIPHYGPDRWELPAVREFVAQI